MKFVSDFGAWSSELRVKEAIGEAENLMTKLRASRRQKAA
jgi:hypothetical protein